MTKHTKLFAVAAMAVALAVAQARPGQTVAEYPVGSTAAGYVPRPAPQNAARYQGPVQAVNASTQQVKLQGVWIPVAQVWVPSSAPTAVPSYQVGNQFWWLQVQQPISTGIATIGGHRITNIGKVVLCLWTDGRTQALTTAQCNNPPAGVVRVHTENTDKL